MTEAYIFHNAEEETELARLKRLEQACDPFSLSLLEQLSVPEGSRCLEVGAGAGSIARQLCALVGEKGQVVALDKDTRFLASGRVGNLAIRKADIITAALEEAHFDLIHARYVLIHLPQAEQVLAKLIRALKPGGWILMEEPDFSFSKPPERAVAYAAAFYRIREAISRLYEDKGLNPRFGMKLKELLEAQGMANQGYQIKAESARGGEGIAEVMRLSALHLQEAYLQTGAATENDIETYCRMAQDPNFTAVYYATIAAWAQKPKAI